MEKLDKLLKAKLNSDENDDNSNKSSNNPYKYLKKEFTEQLHILLELGLYGFKQAFTAFKSTVNKRIESYNQIDLKEINELIESLKMHFDYLLSLNLPDEDEQEGNKILGYSSKKVNALVDIYREAYRTEMVEISSKFHSIIFVDRKRIAFYLNSILEKLSNSCENLNFIKCSFVYGTSMNNAEQMNPTKQVKKI